MPHRATKINASKSLKLRLPPSAIARFLAKCAVDDRGCWIWNACRDSHGYGQFWVNGKAQWAHRIAYAIFRGPLPNGAEVDHRCKNPRCVNPFHVRRRSMAANRADIRRRKSWPDVQAETAVTNFGDPSGSAE